MWTFDDLIHGYHLRGVSGNLMSSFIDLICPPGMTLGPNLYMTGQLSLVLKESCLLTGTPNQPAVTQHCPYLAFWAYFRPSWCLGTPRVGEVGQEKALANQVLNLSADFLKWRHLGCRVSNWRNRFAALSRNLSISGQLALHSGEITNHPTNSHPSLNSFNVCYG